MHLRTFLDRINKGIQRDEFFTKGFAYGEKSKVLLPAGGYVLGP